jgi:hypothetical protein
VRRGVKTGDDGREGAGHPAHRVRLPGFVGAEDVGLGDVVKRVTHTMGIRTCGGCERRARSLNRWLVFTGRGR